MWRQSFILEIFWWVGDGGRGGDEIRGSDRFLKKCRMVSL